MFSSTDMQISEIHYFLLLTYEYGDRSGERKVWRHTVDYNISKAGWGTVLLRSIHFIAFYWECICTTTSVVGACDHDTNFNLMRSPVNISRHIDLSYLSVYILNQSTINWVTIDISTWVWLSKPTNRYTTPIYKHEYIYIVTWPVNVLCHVY